MSEMEKKTKKTTQKNKVETTGGPEKTHGIRGVLSSPQTVKALHSRWLNLLFCFLVPTICLVTLEWIARGTLGPHTRDYGFFQALTSHFPGFFIAWLLLVLVYALLVNLSGSHTLATLAVGLLGNIPAVVTYYKLTMRGEPFLPWDVFQVGDLAEVSSDVHLAVQPSMVVTIILFLVLALLAFPVRLPAKANGKRNWKSRLILMAVSAGGVCLLMFGVFLSPGGTAAIGIRRDMWMQDRYYRTNGVITGFLTNLQIMNIDEPAGYGPEAVAEIALQTEEKATERQPMFSGMPALSSKFKGEQQPDIIYLMAESFWDVEALPGISYDRELMSNFNQLATHGASGMLYTPSFGGGTCDVEFEALTGFSMDFLPAGSKPYQQYISGDTFSLPQTLKARGYETTAIHGYGRRFWNRDTAYPRLGIDTFIAEDEFVNPDRRRGFVSDDAMVDMIIKELENRPSDGTPKFIHAVTMQNHTTYDRSRYPAGELVRVTKNPAALPDSTIGQLEDCATGIYEMDAALGKLAAYLRTVERPTILVFWGDHMNPMSDGHRLFETTGFIEKDDTASPALYQTPLLIWNNLTRHRVELGTVAAYDLSPMMMELYGMEKPLYFEFLCQQMELLRVHAKGVVISPDGSVSESLNEAQEESMWEQSILQYDEMFGQDYLSQLPEEGELPPE